MPPPSPTFPPAHAKSPCPPPDVLELLAVGKGSTDDVRLHVEWCDSCRALLDEMRTNEQFLQAFRPALGTGSKPPRESGGEGAWDLPGGGSGGGSGGRLGEGSGSLRVDGTDFASPAHIPGYHNIAEVSRGGQGIVYRGVHTVTKRKVAIKMLLRGAYATPRELHRFEREIEIVAALRHPNIVTVFDSGVTPDGRPYVVMEYIHGVPLDKYVGEKIARASKRSRHMYEPHLRLFEKIAAAVQHAHSRGVIHRDLKPGNILVDDSGQPRIVDFGMARALSLSRGPTPTMTHEFGGTLAYASPEQVAGDPERIDVRTDVYSLGVILFELLTGKHPYEVSGPISDVVRNIESAEPARPSSIEPAIGDEVDTIVLKALAKEPERRYQSAGELAHDVEDYLAGRPISARSDSAWYLVRKLARRHKTGVLTGCAVALLLAGCAAAAIVADRAHVHLDGVREGFMRFAATLRGTASGEKTARERFRGVLDGGSNEIGPIFAGLPADEANVRESFGYGYWEIQDQAKAEEQFRRALTLREAAGAPLKDIVEQRMRLAWVCSETPEHRFDDALAYLGDDVVGRVRASGDARMLADVLLSINRIRITRAQLENRKANDGRAAGESVPLKIDAELDGLAEARRAVEGLAGAEGTLDAIDMTIASANIALGHLDEALATDRAMYERARTRHGDRHMETAIRLDSVADCEFMLRRYGDALAHYQQVHDVYRKLLIPPDIRLVNSLKQLAAVSEKLDQAADAARYRDEAGEMERELTRTAPKR